MIFGNKDFFAVEAALQQGDEHIFINYCYWVRSNPVGDYQQPVLLSSVILNIENILEFAGKRSLDENNYNVEDLSSLVINSYNDEEDFNFISDEKMFHININYSKSENMDGYCTFLIEMESYEWLLFGDIIKKKYYNAKIPKGQFYKLMLSFLDWIRKSIVVVLRKDYE